VTVCPSFFLMAKLMAPRTEWDCQSVTSIISAIVALSRRCNQADQDRLLALPPRLRRRAPCHLRRRERSAGARALDAVGVVNVLGVCRMLLRRTVGVVDPGKVLSGSRGAPIVAAGWMRPRLVRRLGLGGALARGPPGRGRSPAAAGSSPEAATPMLPARQKSSPNLQ
jgi:hypothetical protein